MTDRASIMFSFEPRVRQHYPFKFRNELDTRIGRDYRNVFQVDF